MIEVFSHSQCQSWSRSHLVVRYTGSVTLSNFCSCGLFCNIGYSFSTIVTSCGKVVFFHTLGMTFPSVSNHFHSLWDHRLWPFNGPYWLSVLLIIHLPRLRHGPIPNNLGRLPLFAVWIWTVNVWNKNCLGFLKMHIFITKFVKLFLHFWSADHLENLPPYVHVAAQARKYSACLIRCYFG